MYCLLRSALSSCSDPAQKPIQNPRFQNIGIGRSWSLNFESIFGSGFGFPETLETLGTVSRELHLHPFRFIQIHLILTHMCIHSYPHSLPFAIAVRRWLSLPPISVGSPISMVISVVISVVQLHGFNSDIAKFQNPGLNLQGGSWLKIEGSYIHFVE